METDRIECQGLCRWKISLAMRTFLKLTGAIFESLESFGFRRVRRERVTGGRGSTPWQTRILGGRSGVGPGMTIERVVDDYVRHCGRRR
jgi:hypothetical protein